MIPSENEAANRLWAVVMSLMGLVQIIGLGVASWLLLAMNEIQRDMAGMKANRFTIQDGYEMEKKIGSELLGLWKEINMVKGDVRSISERTRP